ncbi:hypothetical protein PINS_up001589 [Pythium insidiosum]|nr:hypothetical protein PINS_up001589 [Pythium insidiosum]
MATTASRKRKMMDAEGGDGGAAAATQTFEWENSKENVMPLKRGRKVEDLNRALRTQDSFQGKTKVAAQAKEEERKVNEYEGDDPLSAWAQYIKWIEVNMPEDTRKRFSVLEKCTRELKDHARYKNDIRYIRMWIQYADLVSNPKDIFKYLYQNKIGENVSLFYVGWAWVLESMANYAQAHKVYLKATQKKAQPTEFLETKYRDFQRRMARHWANVNTEERRQSSRDQDQRHALGDITTDGVELQRFGNSESFRRYAQQQANRTQAANAHKPVFRIYEDPIGAEVDLLDGNADWNHLSTHQHQNKENDSAPTHWNAGPLNPTRAPAESISAANTQPRAQAALQVFVDAEFSTCDRSIKSARDRSLTLRQRLDGISTEEEQLAQKPLKNFNGKQDNSKPPRDKPAQAKPREKTIFDHSVLLCGTDGELSFEEVRARQFKVRVSAQTVSRGSNPFLLGDAAALEAIKPSQAKVAKMNSGKFTGQEQVVSKPAAALSALDTAAQEDMTINTRVAMEDVNDMFCSPQRQQAAPPKAWDPNEAEPVERKLHFSIFEDSMDSSAIHIETSFKAEAPKPIEKTSFSVFLDDEAEVNPPRTTSKMSARKPLGSRDDLARRARLTNKDMIMHIQSGEEKESSGVSDSR